MEKEKSTDEVDNEGSQNVWGKIKYFFSLMTIEPMMIVQVRVCFLYFKYKVYFTLMFKGIATNIVMVPQEQMLLYKICTEEKFNLTSDFCSDIEAYTNTTSYDDVRSLINTTFKVNK